MSFPLPLCARLDLRQSLALLEAPLLLQPQDLEAVEVGEGLPPLLLQDLLVPVAGLPQAVDISLLPGSLDGTAPCAAGQLRDDDRGQEDVGQSDGLPGDTAGVGVCCRAVDENLYAELAFPHSSISYYIFASPAQQAAKPSPPPLPDPEDVRPLHYRPLLRVLGRQEKTKVWNAPACGR